MRADVANVFLKILEEPPGSATLILTAPSAVQPAADHPLPLHAVSFRAAAGRRSGDNSDRRIPTESQQN